MSQENLPVDNYYTTSDLALAATLALYYPIKNIDKTNPTKAKFIFQIDRSDYKLESLIQEYWQDKIRVSPLTYFNQIKLLKARLHE